MSKGLDELQFMRERDMLLPSCANTIEQELKDYEKLLTDIFPHPMENGEEYRQLAVKKLKALEVIKEKQVDVRMFIIYNLENYNKLQKNDYCKLTKAEDDLLKEVLL